MRHCGQSNMKQRMIHIGERKQKLIVLSPKYHTEPLPGILWIHGGGYMLGMASMVHVSRGKELAKKYGAVVISPAYRLAWQAPYPAALEDCYDALLYMWNHADDLGIDRNRIIVGGESAGGGLAAALCMYARDQGVVKIAMQIPLYPMLDCFDTESSKDNHGRVWNTRKNHLGWKYYLGKLSGQTEIPVYASAARETDYHGLPKCYTFVCEGEPFYQETLDYIQHLKDAGVMAEVDVYPGNIHAFDMLCPWLPTSKQARETLCRTYQTWMEL